MKSLQTTIANDIDATDGKTKYDTQVKKVLANKIILAWILKYTVKEFFQFTISDIEKCIEGKPEVAVVPMEAGLTNTEIITGSHTEDAIPNEGKITYDIRFYVIFEIPMSVEFEQEVEEMCNLSSYVEEKGRAEGREEGKKEGELNIIILYNWLKESGREADAEAVMKPENEELRSALYIEYDKVKK